MVEGISQLAETINITPSARILRVLGDIDFDNWQCVAELVDNSFDDFVEIERAGLAWPDGFQVGVTLPGNNTPLSEAEVIISDTGRGMDLATLRNAVRAGWSSNDPFSKLGLFGMGFNVASARLGRVTRVLTTRPGDGEWIGVEINLDTIGDDFAAPVVRDVKSDPRLHGTRVIVRQLEPTRAAWLQRNQASLRKTLGDVYSYLLDQKGYELTVNGVRVLPRRACRWGDNRSVTFGSGSTAEQIPAYIPIDKLYPPADMCLACRNWQDSGQGACVGCGSTSLQQRERRLHGWLGIQRYVSKTEFGIDFFRNGRKIVRYDKRLFSWTNPNDPVAEPILEYPIELGLGRIIGEIHLDHVPVTYQKNAFDWNDRGWKAAATYLRGAGPLQPRIAKQLGYPENMSPLAQLHRAYRRHDPGIRYLIPGENGVAIHEKTRAWAERFYAGDPEYQTDEKWWDAIVYFEEAKTMAAPPTVVGGSTGAAGSTGDILVDLGLADTPDNGETSTNGSAPALAPPKPESEQDRLERYRNNSKKVPSLSGDFGLVQLGTIKLTTYEVHGTEVRDADGQRTPVLLARRPGNAFDAFIDASHPFFIHFADDPADLVMVELAHHLRTRANSNIPLSETVARLKEQHLADRRLDGAALASQARELMRAIQERMADAIRDNPARAWQYLGPEEKTSTEYNLVNEGATVTLDEAQQTGDFLIYAPPGFIPRLVEEWPDAFMDGHVFVGPYAGLASDASKRLSVGKVAGYLHDVARLAGALIPLRKAELVRARMSLELLPDEVAPETSAGS